MGWSHKKNILILLYNFLFLQMSKTATAFWMWDLSALQAVLWTTYWIVTWRHGFTRLPLGGHCPLLIPYLCASPWIKFLAAACGKTGLRTEQRLVGDVVYLMRLDQRWSNKSELRPLNDSLLLPIWHSQSTRKYAEGWLQSEWRSHLLQSASRSSRGRKGPQTPALSGNRKKMKGEEQS